MPTLLLQKRNADGTIEFVPMDLVETSSGESAGLVVVADGLNGSIYKIPTIASVATSEINIDVLTTAQIVGARATVNAPDTLTAATRLAVSGEGIVLIGNDETVRIISEAAITSLHVAFLANIAVVEAAYSAPTATGTIYSNTTVADYLTIQVQFDFSEADDIHSLDIQLVPLSDGTTDKNLGVFKVVGYAA